MTHVADLVMETTTTMGVGDITLLGAVDGFFGFLESFNDGDEIFCTQRQTGGAREVFKGTFHAPSTLTRDVILRSSVPGNGPVNWGDGKRVVFACLPASQVLLAENALSEIANFLIADNHLSEIAALGGAAKDAALGNLGGLATGIALFKTATAAAARTVLALGTVAVLDGGTAAGNAVVLAAGGKLPAVPGDLLTALPFHTHSILVAGMTGGANNTVLRYSSAGVVTAAAQSDSAAQLSWLFARGSDGVLYMPPSAVPFAGVAAGTRYYLGAAGALTTTEPVPDGTHTQVLVGMGLDTNLLGFRPQQPVGGNTGSAVALKLEGGVLKI